MLLEFLGDEAFVSFMLPNPINQEKLLKDPKQLENLKKTIWSIWPLSIRTTKALLMTIYKNPIFPYT